MAATAQPLGEVRVPVADRGTEARNAALATALEQVLVRLTGSREAAVADRLAGVRRDPSRWVQQFAYLTPAPEQEPGALALDIRFDVPVLMRQIEQAGSPVWTTVRPTTLMWVVVQRSAGGEILASASDDPAARSLREAAAGRGLPVQLPLMDGEDQGRVRAADIRGHFDNVLMKAAARYGASFNVAAVLYPGPQLQLRWRLLVDGRIEASGEESGGDESALMATLVDRIADQVAGRYVLTPGQASAYSVVVDGVQTLDQWRAITAHASRLAGVSDVQVAALNGSELALQVVFRGAPDSLLALLRLEPRLMACPMVQTVAPVDQATVLEAAPLRLCWQESPGA